jgi:hypothetical protein
MVTLFYLNWMQVQFGGVKGWGLALAPNMLTYDRYHMSILVNSWNGFLWSVAPTRSHVNLPYDSDLKTVHLDYGLVSIGRASPTTRACNQGIYDRGLKPFGSVEIEAQTHGHITLPGVSK